MMNATLGDDEYIGAYVYVHFKSPSVVSLNAIRLNYEEMSPK